MSRRERLQQMLQENPHDAFLQYALAMEDRSAGNDQAALDGLQQVLAVDPRYVAAYFQQGQILAGLGQTGAARTILSEGIVVARQVGDDHAAGEMVEYLASLPVP